MNRVRASFLDATAVAIDLVAMPEVAAKWDDPSALAMWSVSGLAGHLVRATASVEIYLDSDPDPAGEAISVGAYYQRALVSNDLDADEHRAIRARGDEMAAAGIEALRMEHVAVADRLGERLRDEAETRNVRVFGDMVMLLDDYLVTRIVELTCHIDDLAMSIGVPAPQIPLAALDTSVRALVSIARHRHGDLAVIRAMARRERAPADTLRVF